MMAIAMFWIRSYIQKSNKDFNENKEKAVAEVVGYDIKARIPFKELKWDLLVKFVDNEEFGSDHVFLCITDGVYSEDYPVGSKINVLYTKKKFGALSTASMIMEGTTLDDTMVENGFKWIGMFFF